MPLYEYECVNGHRFEAIRPMERRGDPIHCDKCRGLAHLVMSRTHWYMGWKFLKEVSRKSEPAPNDAGYHADWDS